MTELRLGRGYMTNHTLDRFVAPHLSQLTQCNAPDISQIVEESELWLVHFIMNSSLRFKIEDPSRQLIFGFLRRAQAAVDEYRLGRNHLLGWVTASREGRKISDALAALRHMEACLGLLYQALLLAKELVKAEALYRKNDGSPVERLNRLYNASHHSESRFAAGQVPESATSPLWITDAGIASLEGDLTFNELEELFREVAQTATFLSNPPAPEGSPGPAA